MLYNSEHQSFFYNIETFISDCNGYMRINIVMEPTISFLKFTFKYTIFKIYEYVSIGTQTGQCVLQQTILAIEMKCRTEVKII